ncbi:hypothetical protein ACHAW5_003470 [Stephanodiscus triporus]|uniref:Helicase-associated domain-containing protein n=1 Tax=Stephanodiscus triporus TaxID=2934178 RepID=A0ABD3MK72_9STRA
MSSMTVDQIAELAKKELDAAEAGVEHARRQLKEAEERHARAKDQFVEADLQRNCSWNIMYQHLLDYKQAHGDVLVLTSKDSSPDVKKLSKWVQNQRVHYKYYMNGDTKHIKKHRIDALNKIGFVWSTLEHAWDINFADLKSFHEEHGHFDVPKKHGARLNCFVTNIRKAMRRKKEGLHQKDLTEERINRLNSINFTWDPKNPIKQRSAGESPQYDELYNLLVDFKQHYGHVHVAKMIPIWRNGDEGPPKPEYKRLTSFIGSVRNEHELFLEGKPCLLDAEKVRRLTELGVKWKRPGELGRGTWCSR